MNKPLSGITVVEDAYFVAGPSAGMNLADWGANVIKIEPPFGDPGHRRDEKGVITTRDEYFNVYNRGVKDIVINQRDPEGKELTYKILENADVFLTAFREPALKKMGLDWETLHEKFPRLIYADVTGFGNQGPDAADPGYDTVAFWARSGLMRDCVNRGDSVAIPPVAFGDLICGAMMAGAIGTALYQREQTGEGSRVSLSLYALGLYAMTYIMFDVQTGGEYPHSRLEPSLPLMNSIQSGDGKWFYMANVDHEKHYGDLMHNLGRDDLVDDERYKSRTAAQKNVVELTKLLDSEFAKHTGEEVEKILVASDIAYSNIRSTVDNVDDAQARANDFLLDMHMRDGITVQVPSTPVRFGVDPSMGGVAPQGPLMGENTEEVLKGIGCSDEEIQGLKVRKVVVGR